MHIISDPTLQDHFLAHPKVTELFPTAYHQQLQLCFYSAGEVICQQDEKWLYLAIFLKGKIKIVRRLFNGKEVILGISHTPTILGEIELMTKTTTVSSVIALEDSYLLQLPLLSSTNLLENPIFLQNIGRSLATSLYQQNIQSAANLGYSVKERLATHILSIEKENLFQLELNTLADSFGVSYRHLLRVLQHFLASEILQKKGKTYFICQKKELERLCIPH